MVSAKELQRIEKSAIDGKRYADRIAAHLEKVQPQLDLIQKESLTLIRAHQPEWVVFEGVTVLRVKESKFVGLPISGKKSSAKFDVVDLESREVVCQLTKKEINGWLTKKAISDLSDL